MQVALRIQPCKLLCVPSKAAILIIIWTATVGMLHNIFLLLAVAITYSNTQTGISISMFDSLTYAILAIIMMFYPLSGFIADVYCGQLRTVVVSLCLLFCFLIITCLMELIIILYAPHHNLLSHDGTSLLINSFPGVLVIPLFLTSLLVFIIGLTGYQANFTDPAWIRPAFWSTEPPPQPFHSLCHMVIPTWRSSGSSLGFTELV